MLGSAQHTHCSLYACAFCSVSCVTHIICTCIFIDVHVHVRTCTCVCHVSDANINTMICISCSGFPGYQSYLLLTLPEYCICISNVSMDTNGSQDNSIHECIYMPPPPPTYSATRHSNCFQVLLLQQVYKMGKRGLVYYSSNCNVNIVVFVYCSHCQFQ